MIIEPSGDLRTAAASLFQMFTALTGAGFSEQQALAIITGMVHNSINNDD